VKKTVENYIEREAQARAKTPPPKPTQLTAFMPEKMEHMNAEQLLRLFMDNTRFKRIKDIKDQEVTIEEATEQGVKAKVREYNVSINVPNRLVLHDCADWSRCAPVKQFCKHVGKVLTVMPKDKAVNILRKISEETDKWEFKPFVTSTEE
jgi:hypothetical protein